MEPELTTPSKAQTVDELKAEIEALKRNIEIIKLKIKVSQVASAISMMRPLSEIEEMLNRE